jgi:type I restriction enzyme S subunit
LNRIERCIDDEIPFDLPESWAWARLGSVVYNRGQVTPQEDFCYVDIGSIDNQQQCLNEQETVVAAMSAPSRARKLVEQGDILYSTVRPYLHNMCIIDRQFTRAAIASTGFAVMSCFQGIYNRYLFRYLLSPDFDNYVNDTENSKGVAYPAINDARLYNALVPVPPLAEQERIVARIEKLFDVAERL